MSTTASLKRIFNRDTPKSDGITTINIECIAVDQTGRLGSFYDNRQDAITGRVQPDLKSQSTEWKVPKTCLLYKGRTPEVQNLLEMVGIHQSLRLRILLNMNQPNSIASIITYPRLINENTRFLYFYYESHVETCDQDLIKKINKQKLSIQDFSTTYILTKVISGIHAVIILQLPPDRQNEIDRLLEQIQSNLIDYKKKIYITSHDKALLDQITSTTVYSNIPSLVKIANVYNVWQAILQIRKNYDAHHPLKYIFSLMQSSHPQQNDNTEGNNQINESNADHVENVLLQKLSELKVLHFRLYEELPELLQGKLETRLKAARENFSEIEKLHDNEIHKIRDLWIRSRSEPNVLNSIDDIFNSDVQITIKDIIQQLIISLDNLTSKTNLIKQLQNNGFEYCDVTELGIDRESNEQSVSNLLFKNNPQKIIFCSTDTLKNELLEKWNSLYFQIIEEQRKNPQLILVYADFTYSKYRLETLRMLSSENQTIFRVHSTSKPTSYQHNRKTLLSVLQSNDEFINILLIGESGVGKSTFINAFANYLQFNSLQNAQSGQPVVVIPVSFLITVNDNFDEQLVQFGEPDPNENHANSGQSVTQQCRSYVFDIFSNKKLRIIDSPGFGDTKGNDQDDLNMQGIFSYLNNLTCLHGICFLFKPNAEQLNPFLYSCFTQLFQYFGENIRDNFIFCFTNARSTFFAPGDTRPLLQSLFDSFTVKNIPFEKKNVFCFDSESFRYLVALQKSLDFGDDEKSEFEKSWTRSVEESNRLRSFLCENLRPYRRYIEWQSIVDAQFQINSLIRPILETIRNITRNIILYRSNASIKLSASCIDRPTTICYTYNRTLERVGDFWILSDYLCPLSNTCTTNEQNLTEYRLGYEFLYDQTNESIDILQKQHKSLNEKCVKFARFLMNTQGRQDDPFLSGLTRMIEEEQYIYQGHKQSIFNQQLANELEVFKTKYQQLFNETHSDKQIDTLSDIYKLIKSVDDISMVKTQTDAIKTYQQLFLKSNEQSIEEKIATQL